LLEAFKPPFELIRTQSADARRFYARIPVCLDEELEQAYSVIAYMEDRGSFHEIGWGIHVLNFDGDEPWINFTRAKGRACLHEDVRPFVSKLVHECYWELVSAVTPSRIYRKMAEQAPIGYIPDRFNATTEMLCRWGYRLAAHYPVQRWQDGCWEWMHEGA
jgi:hypothetical protein